jgi:hypothetical protein
MTVITIIGWVLSVMTSLFLLKGATDKLRGTEEMIGNFAFMKLEKYRIHTGVGELLGAILLLINFTLRRNFDCMFYECSGCSSSFTNGRSKNKFTRNSWIIGDFRLYFKNTLNL